MADFLDNIFYFFTEEDYILLMKEYNDILYRNAKADKKDTIGFL